MNLAADLLAVGDSRALALCAGSSEITYGELRERVERTARLLLALKLDPRDRVAIWSENSIFFVISYLAIIRAGLVAVPLNTDAAVEHVARTVAESGVRAMFVSNRYETQAAGSVNVTNAILLREVDTIAPCEIHDGPLPDGSPHDLAALMFTSGSTGRPKGVMLTQGNIACNTRDIVEFLGLESSDRVMVVLPFYYCFGLSLLHTHLAVGGSLVINNQFTYPEKVLQDLERRACTGLAGVPSTFQILLRKSRFAESQFSSLRWLQQAGGRLPNICIRQIVDAFPTVQFYVMYGQTEATARLSYLPPDRLHDKLGSVGVGLPSTRLEVLRSDGQAVTPGSDECGEIVASGGNVALGYWNDENETAKYFRNGRLYTGDIARVDEDGFIYLVERQRDIIKSGGNRIGAIEIEEVIAEIPGVTEVAAVGVPHDLLGEAIVVFVSWCSALNETTPRLLEHCRRKLPSSRAPEAIVHVSELPHNGSGKILKESLRRIAADFFNASTPDQFWQPKSESICAMRIERRSDYTDMAAQSMSKSE